MTTRAGTVGIFGDLDSLVLSIRELKTKGYGDITVYTPVPRHEIDEVLDAGISPVRVFTLVGALTGMLTGYAVGFGMAVDWELIVGGKPINSWFIWVVLMFELAILFGALSTVLGMFLNSRLPKLRQAAGYDPRFSNDKFGVMVMGGPAQVSSAEQIMKAAGAEEVRDV
jgi:molybdopterin-containing oxidoreductase family membrane subunit